MSMIKELRKKINDFHRRRPYIDPIINLVMGAILSDSFGSVRSKLQEGSSIFDVRTWFPFAISLIITIVYFAFFSMFASGKYKAKVLEAFEKKSVEVIEKIDSSDPDRLFEVTIKWNDCFEKIQ